MTTRPVEQRHREAAATLAALRLAQKATCDYFGPTCDCKFGASGKGEQTGCPELRVLIDEYEALANAEQPAPSAPAEFDPWEALCRWSAGTITDDFVATGNEPPTLVTTRRGEEMGHAASGATFREAALDLCRQLGLTESPKGKENT